ncbi:hypothetical protein [Pelagovum pacificum]|uniref:Uncharacterized protein n=1 Tax=Pelagovum pacificum TaxID=2588711 RepID=A0A5C5GG19_9RHOB|nr:hypothetical protein [Pelagovum pacificum]QQA43150.1 hypothetical protein I8N54_00815 [Pelagovum pacificum]TNY33708.1 hypothetical protein FHY64_10700 [Pelagovum pacificum]
MPVISLLSYLFAILSAAGGGYLLWLAGAGEAGAAEDITATGALLSQLYSYGPGVALIATAFGFWVIGFVCHRLQQIRNAIREEYTINEG